MALTHIPLERIGEGDLQRLIVAQAAETLYIDYKRETYGTNDDARAEFLADISSFANTAGGDIVIGMDETGGVPTGFCPLSVNPDVERQRLESMALAGLEPRVAALQTRAVSLAAGGNVLIVRVPRSYNPPHRIIFKGKNRFWARSSSRKYEPNVEELRQMFNAGPRLAERIREFRQERIVQIDKGETPVSLADAPLIVLHVLPYSAFDFRSLSFAEVEQRRNEFPPLGRDYSTHAYMTFDGFVTLSNADGNAEKQHTYARVSRSGVVEGVTTCDSTNGVLMTATVEATIVRYARLYAAGLHHSGVEPPMAVLATVLRAANLSFVTGNAHRAFPDTPVPAGRDVLYLVEGLLETIPGNDAECGAALRPMLDHIANAAGKSGSPFFDADGNYILKI